MKMPLKLPPIVDRLLNNLLVRNFAWMFAANGGRIFIQAASFALVTRCLGPEGFGAFSGTLATVLVLIPVAGWGSGLVLIQHVTREPERFPEFWGNALVACLGSGTVCTLIAVAAGRVLLPGVPIALVLTLGTAELVFGRIVDVAGQAYQAFEHLHQTARLQLLLAGTRLTAAVVFTFLGAARNPVLWARFYLFASVVAAVWGTITVSLHLGRPRLGRQAFSSLVREGSTFAVGLISSNIYNDLDKALLVRLSTLEASGLYALAYRIISMSFAPVRSLLASIYSRMFKAGAKGASGSIQIASKFVPYSAMYGFVVAVGLFVAAPLTPIVFGPDYVGAVSALRWLALIPFFQSIHYFAADALTGAGYQPLLSTLQLCLTALNIGLNLWWIPKYSWRGAAASSLVTDGLLTVVLWGALLVKRRTERSRGLRGLASSESN